MRILLACFLFAAASSVVAPGSMDLRNHYGAPSVETFAARPGIDVTVEYGSDRLACDIEIGPSRHLFDNPTPLSPPQTIPAEDVSEVLEEIAPTDARGKKINEGGFQSSCGAVAFTEYENVFVSRTLNPCGSLKDRDQELGASISFKRDACPKHDWPKINR